MFNLKKRKKSKPTGTTFQCAPLILQSPLLAFALAFLPGLLDLQRVFLHGFGHEFARFAFGFLGGFAPGSISMLLAYSITLEKNQIIFRRPFLPKRVFETQMITEIVVPIENGKRKTGHIQFNNFDRIKLPWYMQKSMQCAESISRTAPKSAYISY